MKKQFVLLLLLAVVGIYGNAQILVTLNLPDPCMSLGIIQNEKVKNTVDFTLSPNPTNGEFCLKITSNEMLGKVLIEVVGIQGRLKYSEQIYSNNNSCIKKFNLKSLTSGVYILSLFGENFNKQQKLIIK